MSEDFTSEVFGEVIKGASQEELKERMLAKMQQFAEAQIDAPRELERKRVDAKLAAKQRL